MVWGYRAGNPAVHRAPDLSTVTPVGGRWGGKMRGEEQPWDPEAWRHKQRPGKCGGKCGIPLSSVANFLDS